MQACKIIVCRCTCSGTYCWKMSSSVSSFSGGKAVSLTYKGRTLAAAVKADSTVLSVREAVARELRKSVHRIELRQATPAGVTDKKAIKALNLKKYVEDEKTLRELGVKDGESVEVKDLGPQFSYRGVFVIEYLGPILIMAAFALRPEWLFGAGSKPVDVLGALTAKNFEAPAGSPQWNAFVQSLAIVLWVLHFFKREVETLFVHKFSRPTMPLSNLFKNSTYYWGFALAVGFPLVNKNYLAPVSKEQVLVGVGLWLASQTVNALVHLQFANMRPAEGSKDRKIPTGVLFTLVSCPNYTAEVLGWVAWSLITQVALGYAFTAVGLLQMTQWALGKHKGYKKIEPKLRRKAIIPFLV